MSGIQFIRRGPAFIPFTTPDVLLANTNVNPMRFLIKQIVLVNPGESPVTVRFYIDNASTPAFADVSRFLQATLQPISTNPFYFSNLRVEKEEAIYAVSDAESAAVYTIQGEFILINLD